MQYLPNGWVYQKGTRDVDQVQGAEQQRQLLEGPIPTIQNNDCHQPDDPNDGRPGWRAEYSERGRHADELGDQRQPINNQQVEQRKPAPECPEAVEYCLRMSALGDSTQ